MLKETLLFLLLSPGFILTIPPVGNSLFMTCKTSVIAVLIHATIFAVILYYSALIPILNRLEGFQTTAATTETITCYTSSTITGIVWGGGIVGAVLSAAVSYYWWVIKPKSAAVVVPLATRKSKSFDNDE